MLDALRTAWARPPAVNFDANDVVWRRIESRMEGEPARPMLVRRLKSNSVAPSSPHSLWRVSALAAAAILVLAVGSTVWRERSSTHPGTQMATGMREVVTLPGQQAVLDLADGSRVRLGPGSRLLLPTTLGTGSGVREVLLQGTGFFSIKHDVTRPFRVRTSAGVIEDVGTEFVVTDYPEMHGMRVVVASGTVAVRRSSAAASTPPLVTLTQGMLARLDTAGTVKVMQNVDLQSYLAWTRGALVFNGTQLREVVPELSRWYDMDVTLRDRTMSERRVTASFEDESAEHALRRLALALHLRVERHGRVVTLWPS